METHLPSKRFGAIEAIIPTMKYKIGAEAPVRREATHRNRKLLNRIRSKKEKLVIISEDAMAAILVHLSPILPMIIENKAEPAEVTAPKIPMLRKL
jgi:hypothetical protein